MTYAVGGVGAYRLGYLAQISLPQGTLQVSTVGILGGGWEVYGAMIVDVPAIAFDNEGQTRFAVTIEQRGPHRVGNFSYATLLEAFAGSSIYSAAITLYEYINTGTDVQVSQLVTGTVMRPTDINALTMTLECEQRDKLDRATVPLRKLERTTFGTTALKDRIPPDSDGEPFPLAFGRFLSYVPSLFSASNANRIQQQINTWYPPVVTPALRVQTTSANGASSQTSAYAYAEFVNASNHLEIDTNSNNPSLDGYVWLSAIRSWGRVWEQLEDDGFARVTSTGALEDTTYLVNVGNQPYIRAGIWAAKFIESESSGVTNPERAIDRKMETYAEIAVNGFGCWEVSMATGVGRLSMNADEGGDFPGSGNDPDQNWEGPGRPAGIASAGVIVYPTANHIPTSGTLHLALQFPGSGSTSAVGDAIFGVSDFTIADLTGLSGGAIAIGASAELRRYYAPANTSGRIGDTNDGWGGTKWERGEFAASGSADSATDKPLYNSASAIRDSRPFRVRIHNQTNKVIAVNAAGMVAAFKLDIGGQRDMDMERLRKRSEWIARWQGASAKERLKMLHEPRPF